MAEYSGTYVQYDFNSNREDLSDIVHEVSAEETPVLSAIGTTKASNVTHEWSTDSLLAAAANAHIEGDDQNAGDTLNVPARPGQTMQILKHTMVVSGTQEKGMDHAGISSMMAYQEAMKIKQIKLDLELAMLDGGAAIGNIRVNSDGSAREMGSLNTYITTNGDAGATGALSTGGGTAAMTAGTDRDLTEAILTTVLAECYTSGANPKMMVVSATNKGVVSDFTGGSTRYVDTDTKELIHSIDVYVGDFHTLQVVPCRQLVGDNVYLIDPDYLKLAELRSLQSYDLAKTGDSFKREMVWECGLEVCNEKAHAIIGDTNG